MMAGFPSTVAWILPLETWDQLDSYLGNLDSLQVLLLPIRLDLSMMGLSRRSLRLADRQSSENRPLEP